MGQRTRFRNYISVQAVTMVFVLIARQFISAPAVVTLVSFLLFLAAMLGILVWETRQADFRRYTTFYAGLVFVLFGILPVLALRIIEWSSPFELVGMLSMSGPQWEKIGNALFMAVLIAHFVDSTRFRITALNESQQQKP